MSNQAITDKTHVIQTRSLGRHWVTENQAAQVKAAIVTNLNFIEIEGNLIMVSDIAGIVSAAQIEELDQIKRGDWKCKYNHWHQKGNTCAHGMLP